MLSLTLGHLNQKMFLEQPCFFRTKEGLGSFEKLDK